MFFKYEILAEPKDMLQDWLNSYWRKKRQKGKRILKCVILPPRLVRRLEEDTILPQNTDRQALFALSEDGSLRFESSIIARVSDDVMKESAVASCSST